MEEEGAGSGGAETEQEDQEVIKGEGAGEQGGGDAESPGQQ